MELETKALETRDAANSREIKEAFGEFLRAFEAFKESNDERLAQIEKRSADVVARRLDLAFAASSDAGRVARKPPSAV